MVLFFIEYTSITFRQPHFTLTAAQSTFIDSHELEDDATTKIDEVDFGPDGRGTAFDRG